MHRRGMIEQFFLNCVTVETCDGAKSTRDCGSRTAASFEVTTETFNVGAARFE